MRRGPLSLATYLLTLLLGAAAFLYPFLAAARGADSTAPAQAQGPLLTVLITLCLLLLLMEAQGGGLDPKSVALLGVLVAMNSALRFVETAFPGPGGFSPIFLLVVVAGYVFGARFGFLMGALTLLVSALVTGAVGPWLPYQMFAAGWMGLSAAACRPVARLLGARSPRSEALLLALFAALWGLLYGLLVNAFFWPFAAGPIGQSWEASLGLGESLRRYGAFYLVTSLAWDALRAAGNLLLLLAFGVPVLRILRRFRRRFGYTWAPAGEPGSAA